MDWCQLTDDEAAADEGVEVTVQLPPLRSPHKTAYRISLEYNESEEGVTWASKFKRLSE